MDKLKTYLLAGALCAALIGCGQKPPEGVVRATGALPDAAKPMSHLPPELQNQIKQAGGRTVPAGAIPVR